MAVIQTPGSSTLASVSPGFKSLTTSIKPDDSAGAYQIGVRSGAMTVVAANAPVFSFRFAPGTGQLCVVKRVTVSWVTTTGFTAGQAMGFGIFYARNFLTSDSGGTAIAPINNNNQQFRTKLDTAQVTDLRIPTTGALTAGTRTLDAQPLGAVRFFAPTTTAGTQLLTTNLLLYSATEHPMVLQNNEGFVINNQILMGAAGVGTLAVNVEWFETDAYKASVNT